MGISEEARAQRALQEVVELGLLGLLNQLGLLCGCVHLLSRLVGVLRGCDLFFRKHLIVSVSL